MSDALAWLSWENPVAVWWIGLISISVLNMAFWFFTKIKTITPLSAPLNKFMVAFSGFYVFGCAYRSFFPKADVQRICLFDTWLSSVFLGRTVATVAELSFVLQWALILYFYGKYLNNRIPQIMAQIIVVLITVAECFSWYAVITTNYLGNMIE